MTTTAEGATYWFQFAGLSVHVSESMHATARTMRRGDVLLVTPEVRRANTDRLGRCLFDLDEEQPFRRFGKVMFVPGEPPPDLDRLERDSPEWDAARSAAYLDAARISDPDEQRRAAARVRERFGSSSAARSRTLMAYDR